jgi:3-deoxy-manno-octulosonate cytidylyltransferase (CMP-KDO synthetase)
MRKNKYDIATLASKIQNAEELQNTNIVKVETFENLDNSNFIKAKDFYRKTMNTNKENIYHHIGIYAFSKNTLSRFVKLSRTKTKLKENLSK